MRAIQQIGPDRYLFQRIDKLGSAILKPAHDIIVVDDFMIDIYWRAKFFESQIEALDRHIHSGTKPARIGKDDFHYFLLIVE